MHDVQNEHDTRGIGIDEVGVSGVRYPIAFDDGYLRQEGIADVEITVRLQAERRGTHMSRMIALVHEELATLSPQDLPRVLKTGLALLDAPAIAITVTMPLATRVTAPASGQVSWQVHNVTLRGCTDDTGTNIVTAVTTHVTSLCPCSKAISDYGAHNQRSEITLEVTGDADAPYPLSVGDSVELLRGAGSSPVIPLVKRSDERVLTMEAYDHPVFVEDMVRNVSLACRQRSLIHTVRARNLESIHSHDAVAFTRSGTPDAYRA